MRCTVFGPCYVSDSQNTFTWQGTTLPIILNLFLFFTLMHDEGDFGWCSHNALIELRQVLHFLHGQKATELVPFTPP